MTLMSPRQRPRLGWVNNLLRKEERRISASFEVHMPSLLLFVVCH
jgi:hypothetical protein